MSSPESVANPYQKRLGLLAAGMVLILSGLIARHAWLSLVMGEDNRLAAMAALTDVTILPTIRGSILDVRGQVLAEDRAPGLAVEIRFELIDPTAWVRAEAERKARQTMGSGAWRRLEPAERDVVRERAWPEAAARRLSMLRTISRHTGVPLEDLLEEMDDIHASVMRMAAFVQRRQELDWAAAALGTDRRTLESMAMPVGDDDGVAGPAVASSGPHAHLAFSSETVAALGLEPPRPGGVWTLDRLLELRGVDLGEFQRRPIREQVSFHELIAPVAPEAARAIAVAANTLGLGDVVRLSDARVRARPWTDADVVVEVDGSMLPGPRRFDGVREVTVKGVGDRLLGSLSPVYAEEGARRRFDPVTDRGGYRAIDDRVGRTGIEAMEESRLRGERGLRRDRVRLAHDAETEAERGPDSVPRIEGEDIRTTIDIRLQARIRAALHPDIGLSLVDGAIHGASGLGGVPEAAGQPLAIGVAVVDVATGDILALVNGPDRDELPDPDIESIVVEEGWLDLDIAGRWGTTPGSTIKPLILTAAISEGLSSASDLITCTGHYYPWLPNSARCWIYRPPGFATHGDLNGADAIAQSCNIYFHRTADSFLGREDRLIDWLAHFGLGRRPGERSMFGAGILPDAASIRGAANRDARIMMGTGQAAMVWTPLQAAGAYASFFRAGTMPELRLLVDDGRDGRDGRAGRERGEASAESEPAPCVPTAEAIYATAEGLNRSVAEWSGTANHINLADGRHRLFTPNAERDGRLIGRPYESVMIWGKTGTAQEAVRLRLPVEDDDPEAEDAADTGADGDASAADPPDGEEDVPKTRIEVRTLSHGWFAGIVAADDLSSGVQGEYAIAVVVRWGGSGGYTAGPIANQVVLALMQEGYLPMEPGLRPTSIRRRTPSPTGSGSPAIASAAPDQLGDGSR